MSMCLCVCVCVCVCLCVCVCVCKILFRLSLKMITLICQSVASSKTGKRKSTSQLRRSWEVEVTFHIILTGP